jgi:hypothetical protein
MITAVKSIFWYVLLVALGLLKQIVAFNTSINSQNLSTYSAVTSDIPRLFTLAPVINPAEP